MAEMHDVVVKVISQTGKCEAGHKLDDEFVLGQTTPEGMCAWAFCALWPFATALQAGGSFPWEEDGGKAIVSCPDSANPVVFELKRR